MKKSYETTYLFDRNSNYVKVKEKRIKQIIIDRHIYK